MERAGEHDTPWVESSPLTLLFAFVLAFCFLSSPLHVFLFLFSFASVQDHKLGAIISKVREGTPAHRFGLQVKDVVLTAGGETVGNRTGMVKACLRYAPGDSLPLTFLRGKAKQPMQMEVEVGAAGLTAEEVRDLKRRCEGRITDDDIQRSFAMANPIAQQTTDMIRAVTHAIGQTPQANQQNNQANANNTQQQQQQQQEAKYN